MTENVKETIVTIADVISKEYEGQPTRLKLEVTEDNMFTGKTEVSSVALTESESIEGKDFMFYCDALHSGLGVVLM